MTSPEDTAADIGVRSDVIQDMSAMLRLMGRVSPMGGEGHGRLGSCCTRGSPERSCPTTEPFGRRRVEQPG